MSDSILLPCPDGWLALSPAEYAKALAAARSAGFAAKIAQNASQRGIDADSSGSEPLLAAAQLSEALGLSKTWVEQAARDGRIPFVRAGRYVRFRRAEVEAHLRTGDAHHRKPRRKVHV